MTRAWQSFFFFLVLAPVAVRAAWADLRIGVTEDSVVSQVGEPLFCNFSRGWATWIYDTGGYVAFESGRVVYWRVPRDAVAAAVGAPAGDAVPPTASPRLAPSAAPAPAPAPAPKPRLVPIWSSRWLSPRR